MKIPHVIFLTPLLFVCCTEDQLDLYSEPAGKLAKEIFYDAEETWEQGSITYKYDVEGKLLRKEYSGYIRGNTATFLKAYEEFNYDSEGRLSGRVRYDANAYKRDDQYKLISSAQYVYDVTGHLQMIREEGLGTKRKLYFFNDQEQNTRIEYFISSANFLNRYVELEYNQEGQLIRDNSYTRDDKDAFPLVVQHEFQYTLGGNLVRKLAVGGIFSFTPGIVEEYEYDATNELLIKTSLYHPGREYTLANIVRYQYY
ncbi:MAG: hypothetical protein AAGE93_28360 [Bacteroidota bacterium]